jgi:multidrug efflux pump subunit AcrA (membrane-fusion protein)
MNMGRGMDMRMMDLKIQDIVPEGTIVKEGDYIAQLDRSSYSNSLKDARDNLTTESNNLEMKVLDTAVTMTSLRDDIKNQKFVVEEARITLAQSKYEPPATIRQAEIALDKAQRALEQKIKSYDLKKAQTLADIRRQKLRVDRAESLVTDLQEFLGKFTITAPADGMVIYKKERNGAKRKTGSNVNPFDRVVATLPDLTSMISKIYVNEIEVAKVKPGLKVNIKVDAFPNKAYTGTVMTVANIGEVLPNSDSKMFEVQIKIDQSDMTLRPSMTTDNRIIIKSFDDVIFIPTECVYAGIDTIPFVYKKNRTRQVVELGEANDKHVIVRQGLKEGESLFTSTPIGGEGFRLVGEDLLSKN